MKNKHKIFLSKVNKSDLKLLLSWANEQYKEGLKINTKKKITLEEHRKWFHTTNNNEFNFFYMIHYKKNKVGQIRLEKKRNLFEIDIFIDKSYRRNNIAAFALKFAISNVNVSYPKCFLARVKSTNIASIKFFKKLGFECRKDNKEVLELVYKISGAG